MCNVNPDRELPTRQSIVIYRDHLLHPSETFIRAQAEGLKAYIGHYVGTRSVDGLSLPTERVTVLNTGTPFGKVGEITYKLTGFSPKLYRSIRTIDPRLIHAHHGWDGAAVLPLSKRLGIPLLVTFHGSEVTVKDAYARKSFYSARAYLRRRSRLIKEATQFIAVSHFIKQKMIDQGYNEADIRVHYIGVDTKLFKADPHIARAPIVLFVGRLAENKGCRYLIKAMSQIQTELPGTSLVVIGDGPERIALEQLASASLTNFSFLGAQTPSIVRQWMNQAMVLAGPSVTIKSGDSEGFGMVFAEAQSMGLPVVGFKTGGISEAVAHGETGLLSNEKDWRTLASHLLLILTDTDIWQRFSVQGRNRTLMYFNLESQIQSLEQLYHEIEVSPRNTGRMSANKAHFYA